MKGVLKYHDMGVISLYGVQLPVETTPAVHVLSAVCTTTVKSVSLVLWITCSALVYQSSRHPQSLEHAFPAKRNKHKYIYSSTLLSVIHSVAGTISLSLCIIVHIV